MRRADLVSSGLLTLAGLLTLFFVIPAETGKGATYGLAADFFPNVSVIALTAIMGAFFVYRAVFRSRAGGDDDAPVTPGNWRFLGAIAAFFAVDFLVLAVLGFIAGGALAVAAFMVLAGERRAIPVALASACVPTAIFLVVAAALRIPLP